MALRQINHLASKLYHAALRLMVYIVPTPSFG
jgi:hypothetical protein